MGSLATEMNTLWKAPSDVTTRPVAVIGGGQLGRRIALMWGSRGRPVNLCEKVVAVRKSAEAFYASHIVDQVAASEPGQLAAFDNMQDAVQNAWLVIEAIPERLDLKHDVFKMMEASAPTDAIFATNSSSFKSRDIAAVLKDPSRVCNMHYFNPPENPCIEVMTSGSTHPEMLEFVMAQAKLHGQRPFLVMKESSGFIENRVWAAIKREALMVLAEGCCTVESLDELFMAHLKAERAPFRFMDQVGLDVVLDIEEHYAAERPGLPESPRTLLKAYIAKGWLGQKSGRGFYVYDSATS